MNKIKGNMGNTLGTGEIIASIEQSLRHRPEVTEEDLSRISLTLYNVALGIAAPIGFNWVSDLPPLAREVYMLRDRLVHDQAFFMSILVDHYRDPRAIVQAGVDEKVMEYCYAYPDILQSAAHELSLRIVDRLTISDMDRAIEDYTQILAHAQEIVELVLRMVPYQTVEGAHAIDLIQDLADTGTDEFQSAAEVEDYSNRVTQAVELLVKANRGN